MYRSALARLSIAPLAVFTLVGACSSSSSDDSGITSDGGSADVTLGDANAGDSSTTADGGACPNLPAPTLVDPTSATALTIAGDPSSTQGIYDPSFVYPVGAPGGVLSYSTVGDIGVSTRVAVSTDKGATFTYVAAPNAVTAVDVSTTDPAACDGGASCSVSGVLWHEVSSIVADPTDPDQNGAFKLFVHSYFASPATGLRRDWGYIGLQTAKTLDAWSTEKKALGWTSSGDLSTSGVSQNLSDIPALADCIAFTEPGAIVTPGGIDLALSCAAAKSPTDIRIRVVLLRSTDHAQTFSFVSTLVSDQDYACLGGTVPQILGADLFFVGAQEYLSVTPVGPIDHPADVAYRGCVTIPLADGDAGTIARASNGAPAASRFVQSSDDRFTGPCTYAEGATSAGEMVPMQFHDGSPPYFRIMRTSIAAP